MMKKLSISQPFEYLFSNETYFGEKKPQTLKLQTPIFVFCKETVF